jgi:hypothetical protein
MVERVGAHFVPSEGPEHVCYGNSGPVGYTAYRFIHYGEPAGLDDELRQRFLEALRRINTPQSLELAGKLEGELPL